MKQNIRARLQQLEHENYILQTQVEAKFFQMNLLLEHLPIILIAINASMIIELIQGKGLSKIKTRPEHFLGQDITSLTNSEDWLDLIESTLYGEKMEAIIQLKKNHYFHCIFLPQKEGQQIERVFIIANDIDNQQYKDLEVIEDILF